MKIVTTREFEKSLKRLIRREQFAFINPAEYYRKIKWFIQRGVRGYSDCDLWNANDHIARTVLAFLEHNEKCKMAGYPMGLTEKKWENYKAEIKWLMELELNRQDVPIEVLKSESHRKRCAKANRIFGRYWAALWD